MGTIKKIIENELVGGVYSTDIYPITSIKAVYDENNKSLDVILSDSQAATTANFVGCKIGNNIFDKDNVTKGYYLDSNGTLIANDEYAVSGFMKVDPSVEYYTDISLPDVAIPIEYDADSNPSLDDDTDIPVIASPLEYDDNFNVIGILSADNQIFTPKSNAHYVRLSVKIDLLDTKLQVIKKNLYYGQYEPYTQYVIDNSMLSPDIIEGRNIINAAISEEKTSFFEFGKNLLNPEDEDFKAGYYLDSNGTLVANDEYAVSGYILLDEDMVALIASDSNGSPLSGDGCINTYDSDKNVISGEPLSVSGGIVTWEPHVGYARFSLNNYTSDKKYQVEIGDVVTSYVDYTPPQIKKSALPFDIDAIDEVTNIVGNVNTILGGESLVSTADTLSNGGRLELVNYPWHIKKNICLSMEADVTTFDTIYFGKGYEHSGGCYLKLDKLGLSLCGYENEETVVDLVVHNLNISSFVKITFQSNNQGVINCIVSTLNGLFVHAFTHDTTEFNWEVFVASENSSLTNVKISANSPDLMLPVWAFGDGYFGVAGDRWPGPMRDFGYFNFMLNGLAGQNSSAAYSDLLRSLNFGKPKFLLWFLGMNDTDILYIANANNIKAICEEKDITLILATIPTVPERDKEVISQFVRNSGLRYVDFYKAVGASEGWYNGYLSSDGVHPTDIGAKILAAQILSDFPELMQYGNINEN